MRRVLLLACLSAALGFSQGVQTPGGGGGAGTVDAGATNDVACYSGTSAVGPCQTGALTHPASNTLKFNAVTMTFVNGVFTIQDATASTGATQLAIKEGAGQSSTPSLVFQDSSANVRGNFLSQGRIWGDSSTTSGSMAIRVSRTSTAGTMLAVSAVSGAGNHTATSGSYQPVLLSGFTFNPTSGTAAWNSLEINNTFNQTGGANGISREIYLNPTITAAADHRSLEIANVTNSHFAIVTGTGRVSLGGPLALKSNTVSYSATPAFDGATGNIFHMELTGNVTSSTTSNLVDGRLYTFRICTDGTGSYTFVWPTNVKGAMTVGTDANSCSVQDFVSDGTNLWARSLGVINQPE